jgi:hypothetical protein
MKTSFPGQHALLSEAIIIMTMVAHTLFIELNFRITSIHQTARANAIHSFHVRSFKIISLTTRGIVRLSSGQASEHEGFGSPFVRLGVTSWLSFYV